MFDPRIRIRQKASFTVVELLVAIAIFLVLMIVLATFLTQASKSWTSNVQEAEAFQSARFAFQSMTQKMSQATLNTYWDYQTNSSGTPTNYIRQSDLQFTTGLATNLLAGTAFAPNVYTHAAFFIAPLGMTSDITKRSLVGLLNAVGYFVDFGQLPQSSLISSPAPYRYGLYEFFQPTENLQIYSELYQPFNTGWFTNYFSSPAPSPAPYHMLAPNIIALVLRPDDSNNDSSAYDTSLAPSYFYDSKSGSTSPTAGGYTATTESFTAITFNQLPPLLHVTMVAIDENSATRLASQYGTTAPPLVSTTAFLSQANFTNDLTTLQNALVTKHLNYHTFNADVPIRSARWSP